MKKIVLSLIVLLSLITPLVAFSWAGNLNASGKLAGPSDSLDLEHLDRLSLGFSTPLNDENTMRLAAEAFYEFGYTTNLTDLSESSLSHLANLNTLNFNMRVPLKEESFFTMDIGRFHVTDLTVLTLDQKADGVKFVYDNKDIQLNAYVGFTGLLNAHVTTMNVAPNENILSEVYTLASPFILGNAVLYVPQLFAGQDFFAEVLTAIDVSSAPDPDNRVYATAALSGPMGEVLFYNVSSTLGLNQLSADEWGISNLSAFELSAFLPYGSTLLSWKTIFATAGENADFKTFTVKTASIDDTLEFAGHVKTGLTATVQPLDGLLVYVEPNIVINVMNEDVQAGLTRFQWLLAARWNIFSDLNLVGSFGQFLPAESTDEAYLEAELKLSFDF